MSTDAGQSGQRPNTNGGSGGIGLPERLRNIERMIELMEKCLDAHEKQDAADHEKFWERFWNELNALKKELVEVKLDMARGQTKLAIIVAGITFVLALVAQVALRMIFK